MLQTHPVPVLTASVYLGLGKGRRWQADVFLLEQAPVEDGVFGDIGASAAANNSIEVRRADTCRRSFAGQVVLGHDVSGGDCPRCNEASSREATGGQLRLKRAFRPLADDREDIRQPGAQAAQIGKVHGVVVVVPGQRLVEGEVLSMMHAPSSAAATTTSIGRQAWCGPSIRDRARGNVLTQVEDHAEVRVRGLVG